jgi:hypothetical protein
MNSLNLFNTAPFIAALKAFFEELKVPVNYIADEPVSLKDLLGEKYNAVHPIQNLIHEMYMFGMVDDAIFEGKKSFSNIEQVQNLKADYDGVLLFGIILKTDNATRSQLAEITRLFSRAFPHTPVTIVFKYGNCISFANCERVRFKQEWREGEKVGKVIILHDVQTLKPHTGHLCIMKDLAKPLVANNFAQLYAHWLQVLDVNILNKKFFQELANWYFWAMKNVQFPDDIEKKKDIRNATNLIRLITRVIFIWFIKEKKLVPNNLFRKEFLDKT